MRTQTANIGLLQANIIRTNIIFATQNKMFYITILKNGLKMGYVHQRTTMNIWFLWLQICNRLNIWLEDWKQITCHQI